MSAVIITLKNGGKYVSCQVTVGITVEIILFAGFIMMLRNNVTDSGMDYAVEIKIILKRRMIVMQNVKIQRVQVGVILV